MSLPRVVLRLSRQACRCVQNLVLSGEQGKAQKSSTSGVQVGNSILKDAVDRTGPDAERVMDRHSCRVRLSWRPSGAKCIADLGGCDMRRVHAAGASLLRAPPCLCVLVIEHEPVEPIHRPHAQCSGNGTDCSVHEDSPGIISIVAMIHIPMIVKIGVACGPADTVSGFVGPVHLLLPLSLLLPNKRPITTNPVFEHVFQRPCEPTGDCLGGLRKWPLQHTSSTLRGFFGPPCGYRGYRPSPFFYATSCRRRSPRRAQFVQIGRALAITSPLGTRDQHQGFALAAPHTQPLARACVSAARKSQIEAATTSPSSLGIVIDVYAHMRPVFARADSPVTARLRIDGEAARACLERKYQEPTQPWNGRL